MRRLLLLPLLASAALAKDLVEYLYKRQNPNDPQYSSVILVLVTAIPSDTLSMALTNPDGLASTLSSELANGQTPAWYLALPPDVKVYLATAGLAATGSAASARASLTTGTISVPTDLSGLISSAESELNSLRSSVGSAVSRATAGPLTGSARSSSSAGANVIESPDSSSSLSTGAKVGIGVGVPCAVLIVAASVGFFLLGKRKARKHASAPSPGGAANGQHEQKPGPVYTGPNMPEVQGTQTWPAQQYQQPYPGQPQPYQQYQPYAEMGTNANAHELHGNGYQGGVQQPHMQQNQAYGQQQQWRT